MRLIVQIPCYNEEDHLEATVRAIPRRIEGVSEVLILVIDDGSADRTAELARELGVDHIVRHKTNRGLGRAFRTGIDACLRLGADIIVNTDGDNQYVGEDIARLIVPILEGEADIVVGDRRTGQVPHFSLVKRKLQALGSAVVRNVSETDVPDAVSGLRALSRDAALQLNIVSSFSYTIEMIIQAGKKGMSITSVPVRTNRTTRASRLAKSIPQFIRRSGTTIVRMYAMYQPLRVFFYVGLTLTVIGIVPILRFLYFYFTGDGMGHIQSLVLGGTSLILGFVAFLIGLVADLINFNRQLIEMTLEKVRRLETGLDRGARREGPHRREPMRKATEPERTHEDD